MIRCKWPLVHVRALGKIDFIFYRVNNVPSYPTSAPLDPRVALSYYMTRYLLLSLTCRLRASQGAGGAGVNVTLGGSRSDLWVCVNEFFPSLGIIRTTPASLVCLLWSSSLYFFFFFLLMVLLFCLFSLHSSHSPSHFSTFHFLCLNLSAVSITCSPRDNHFDLFSVSSSLTPVFFCIRSLSIFHFLVFSIIHSCLLFPYSLIPQCFHHFYHLAHSLSLPFSWSPVVKMI